MKISEKSTVKAPIQKVWDFLLDPQKMGSCVPGCEKVETIDANSYLVTEAVNVGPISARFDLKVTILEMNPPNRVLVSLVGKDSKTASHFNTKATIKLKSISSNETEIDYEMEVTLGGVLGKFGEGVVRRKADSQAETFAKNIRAALEESAK